MSRKVNMTTKIKENYIDVTDEWMNKPKSFGMIKDAKYFEYNGKLYYVDGKKVVLNYSKNEKEVAELLTNTFGGTIYMIPKIINNNFGYGIKTPDYIWNNERWELKTPEGKSKRTIDGMLKKQYKQSNNFIIDLKNNTINVCQTIDEIKKIFNNPYRSWIKTIILINNKRIILILTRKNETSSSR